MKPKPRQGRPNRCAQFLPPHPGLVSLLPANPRLTPWAASFRLSEALPADKSRHDKLVVPVDILLRKHYADPAAMAKINHGGAAATALPCSCVSRLKTQPDLWFFLFGTGLFLFEWPFSLFGMWHFLIGMRRFQLETPHFWFGTAHSGLEMGHFPSGKRLARFDMERFKSGWEHCLFEPPFFKPGTGHCRLEMEHFRLGMEHSRLDMEHFLFGKPHSRLEKSRSLS